MIKLSISSENLFLCKNHERKMDIYYGKTEGEGGREREMNGGKKFNENGKYLNT